MWTNTNVPEMKAFIAILLFMVYVKFPSYQDYWTTEPLMEMPGFCSIMSRNRFNAIMQFLHITNNEDALAANDPNYDKLYKIRPLTDLRHSFQLGKRLITQENIC